MKGKELPLYRPAIDEKEFVIIKKKTTKWFDSLPMFDGFLQPAIEQMMIIHAKMNEFYYNNKAIGWLREQDKTMLLVKVGFISCCTLGPRVMAYRRNWFVRNVYTVLGFSTGSLIVFPYETCGVWSDYIYPTAESKILAAYMSIKEASDQSKSKDEEKKK